MADAFTGTSAYANAVKTAYDRHNDWVLRSKAQFRDFVDKRPVAQAMPGNVITFTISQDLAALATTPLTETVTPDSVALVNPANVSITLQEFGNWVKHTMFLDKTSFINVDQDKSTAIANNRADTLDALVRAVADGSTKTLSMIGSVIASSGANSGITASDKYNSAIAAATTNVLRKANVSPFWGDYFATVLHPDVAHDLRLETGATGWLAPHSYVDPENIYRGEIGMLHGQRFVENPRCTVTTDGASSGRVYKTYAFGHQALAEATAIEPQIVTGEVTDPLKRFMPLGWYGLLGWSIYRPEALRVVKTQSSIGTLV